tara:strand:- start:35 stop:187 length:153 start_codon:yes stop_codon:yes gene_type:complete
MLVKVGTGLHDLDEVNVDMLRARQTLAVRRTLSCRGQRVGRAQLTAAMAV